MANHKRGKSKAARSGCLMCKPHKLGQGQEKYLGKRGFGKLRALLHSMSDLRDIK